MTGCLPSLNKFDLKIYSRTAQAYRFPIGTLVCCLDKRITYDLFIEKMIPRIILFEM